MKDIGSFIEYVFPKAKNRLFDSIGEDDIICLNSCRAAIYHAVRCYGVNKVWIAKYQCDEVRDFLRAKGVEILFYDMDSAFRPIIPGGTNEPDTAVVFSNYFGILGNKHFAPLLERFHNVIIDNAQALFFPPQAGCINCYSPRKFVPAPDGAYVVGDHVNRFSYEQDRSSDTCQFLFMRQEYGCDMHAYSYKKENDRRIQASDVMLMSPLTKAMLEAVDYAEVKEKRKRNFEYARTLFDGMNLFDAAHLFDEHCVPMGYPLLADREIIPIFHEKHIYQPRYWEYILDEFDEGSMEYRLAKYMALICIDQGCEKNELDYQYSIVRGILGGV